MGVSDFITLLQVPGLVGYYDLANRVVHPPDAHPLSMWHESCLHVAHLVMDPTMYDSEPYVSDDKSQVRLSGDTPPMQWRFTG